MDIGLLLRLPINDMDAVAINSSFMHKKSDDIYSFSLQTPPLKRFKCARYQ